MKWSRLSLKAGKILWQSSVGTVEDRAPLGIAFSFGTPLVNGVVVTAGGLVATRRTGCVPGAVDARSGTELWQGRLPVPGVANPLTYLWKGDQYVAIGAGGHSESGHTIGDSLVAFRPTRGRAMYPQCGRAQSTGPADGFSARRSCSRSPWV